MVIGRPVAAQMQLHAKVRAESAARRLDRGMPARVAREDAAMERRPARALLARECLPKGSIRDEALTGAPSPSVQLEGETRPPAPPGRQQQGRFRMAKVGRENGESRSCLLRDERCI